MAITHHFEDVIKPRNSGYGGYYGYYGYIEDGQLVLGEDLGESWPHTGGITYRGPYEGASKCLNRLKTEAPALYNAVEKYFAASTKISKIGDMKQGDKVESYNVKYLLIDFDAAKSFSCDLLANYVYVLNLDTNKYCFISKNCDCELIN